MTLYLHDFLFILVLFVMALLSWKVKSAGFRIALAVFAVVVVLFNPFKFKSDGGSSIEKHTASFEDLPEKIEAQKPSFAKKQEFEYNNLKKQSEEIQNEI